MKRLVSLFLILMLLCGTAMADNGTVITMDTTTAIITAITMATSTVTMMDITLEAMQATTTTTTTTTVPSTLDTEKRLPPPTPATTAVWLNTKTSPAAEAPLPSAQ